MEVLQLVNCGSCGQLMEKDGNGASCPACGEWTPHIEADSSNLGDGAGQTKNEVIMIDKR